MKNIPVFKILHNMYVLASLCIFKYANITEINCKIVPSTY